MRSITLSQAFIFCVPLALMACGQDQAARSPSGYDPSMTPASGTTTPTDWSTNPSTAGETLSATKQGLNDGQIAAIVRAINVAEIDQGKIAALKAHDVGVKQYAETMIAQHGQAVKDMDELDTMLNIRLTESELMTEMRVNATSVESKLSQNNENSFDKAYLESQIEAHRQALDTIDSQLMPAVRSEELRQMLENLRPRVVDHLQMAQTLLDTLK
jgi:putative membrane protein